MVQPERVEEKKIAPQFVEVERYNEISPARKSWELVFCEDEIDPFLAIKIESRLQDLGYNPGEVDGVIDSDTEVAVENYQMNNGLPSGAMTPTTLQELGILKLESEKNAYNKSFVSNR